MSELDRKIREALRTEDADLFADLGSEPSIFEMLIETFRGRQWWLNVFGAILILIWLVVGVMAAVRFFRAETTHDMLMWAAVCIICVVLIGMLKIWYWGEIHKNAVLRDIKRVELQIAKLAERIRD